METFSKAAVRLLMQNDSRIKNKGFAQEVRRIIFEYDTDKEFEFIEWNSIRPEFIPDAFLVDTDNREIIIYEIEDTNPVNFDKMHKIMNLYWDLEYLAWDVRLIVFDWSGRSSMELPLFELSLSCRKHEA